MENTNLVFTPKQGTNKRRISYINNNNNNNNNDNDNICINYVCDDACLEWIFKHAESYSEYKGILSIDYYDALQCPAVIAIAEELCLYIYKKNIY